jgi:hypothetical protein
MLRRSRILFLRKTETKLNLPRVLEAVSRGGSTRLIGVCELGAVPSIDLRYREPPTAARLGLPLS